MAEVKEKVVKKNDQVDVYGLAGATFMKKGKKYRVHSFVAQTLIERGQATKSKAEADASKAPVKAVASKEGDKK